MSKEIQMLRNKIEDQDKRSGKNNIKITGLTTEDRKPKEVVTEFLEEKLHVKCSNKSATLIKYHERVLLIVAEIEYYKDKLEIMKIKNKLKGQQIYTDNDCTREERMMQAIIRKKATEGKKIKIFYYKLVVDDKIVTRTTEKNYLKNNSADHCNKRQVSQKN